MRKALKDEIKETINAALRQCVNEVFDEKVRDLLAENQGLRRSLKQALQAQARQAVGGA